jgi:hypothetical protein
LAIVVLLDRDASQAVGPQQAPQRPAQRADRIDDMASGRSFSVNVGRAFAGLLVALI